MTKQIINDAHKTAEDAMASNNPGAKTLFCTLEEARKLAGKPAITVDGLAAIYCDPMQYTPGQPWDTPEIWHVPVMVPVTGK